LQRTPQEGKPLILERLFRRKPKPAAALYDVIVAAARHPHFFVDLNVPDTLDGRFDLIVLHLYLVLDRLRDVAETERQNLIDYFFMDMDRSLREMGVGDLSVGKKVRVMAEAFYGRMLAYQAAVEQGDPALAVALERNVYAGVSNAQTGQLVEWIKLARGVLASLSVEDILSAKVKFS
jgi:cytochrome b pre-mRNA-processing protein 3